MSSTTRTQHAGATVGRSIVETLEGRRMFAATLPTAAIVDGTLEVVGTHKADTIFVSYDADAGTYMVESGPTVIGTFAAADFTGGIHVNAGNGNDLVVLIGDMMRPVHVEGGNGKDALAGSPGADVLDGGNGSDAIDGGAGDDIIDGGNGKDDVVGGAGDVIITGGRGLDSIVGGLGADTFHTGDRLIEITDPESDSVLA